MNLGEEQKVIEDIIAGKVNQYKCLVEKYQNPVFRVIIKIVGDYDDAKELTQDVFVKAYDSINQYNPEYKFFSWIYRIAINSALLFIKRKKNFTPIDELQNLSIEQTTDNEQRDYYLNRLINELEDPYKSVILLKYYANLSYAEISSTLGVAEKTVKSRLFDARKIMKKKLSRVHFFEVV